MSTSNTHQQYHVDAGYETRPLMLKREEESRGDDLKHYEAEIEAMNLILISIPNDIYNYVDACNTAKAIEALVSVYNRFAQIMNDLERNGIIFAKVTINTKFLNCLQPKWLNGKCIKSKEVGKSHDPLALVAHTGSSFITTTPYYVTHPSLVVDYDDNYQGDVIQNNSEDPLTSVMILLARTITQHFSNPTNNHLHTSSNTRNQAIVQGDRVNIQRKNSRNDGRNIRCSYVQEEIIEANVQCYNCNEKGHYARNCPKPRFWDSNYFMEQMLLAKQDKAGVILTDEQNNFLFAEEIEELSANICLMAMIQPANFDSDEGSSYDSAFLSEVQTPSTNLEQQRDKLDLSVVEFKRQIVELQKTQSILKRKMNENEDKYHDTVLDLEARAKKNEDVVLKMGNSLQGMFMLGPRPMSFYDSKVKHGLGYTNPYTLKKAISQNLKLYDASCLDDSKIQMNVRDTEDILDDATKSQIKMKKKSQDSIAMRKNNIFGQLITKRLRAISSVRIPSNKDSSFKNSVLSNTKNSSEKVEVSNRSNKKSDVASKNVDSNKKIVSNDDIRNALIAKNVLCVSCAKNMLIPCHDNCLAKYKLNVHSKVRRALFTTSRIVKSKFEDPTLVVSKTRFSIKTIQSKSLDTTPVVSKTKIVAVTPLSAKHKIIQIILWIVASGCSKHMMGDRSLLENFVEKFMGTVRFRNYHFSAITRYGDNV
ncbi:gag-pol polyprotein [Tanacetum coccineum]